MMRVVHFPQQDYCPVKREIHPHLAAMVCASAFVLGVLLFVFTGAPFSFMIDGRLAYISEGFEKYCGWAVVRTVQPKTPNAYKALQNFFLPLFYQ